MAKKPEPPIDAARVYRVDLTKSLRLGRMIVNPGPRTRLRGDIVAKIVADDPEAISGYEAI